MQHAMTLATWGAIAALTILETIRGAEIRRLTEEIRHLRDLAKALNTEADAYGVQVDRLRNAVESLKTYQLACDAWFAHVYWAFSAVSGIPGSPEKEKKNAA